MHRIAKLLSGWRVRIIGTEIGIIGFLAVGAPMTLVLSGLRVVDDHAVIAISVGNIEFVGSVIDEQFRRAFQIASVIAAFAFVGMTDLHQELAVLREFQNLVVVKARVVLTLAVSADPNISLVVYGDAVVRVGPIIALAWATPVADEVALLVELQDRRGGNAALRGRGLSGRVDFHGFVAIVPMNNPNVILGVHGDADGSTDNPMVGKRLRPHGIHFEARRLEARGFRGRLFLEHGRTDHQSDEEREKSCSGKEIALHGFLLCFAA